MNLSNFPDDALLNELERRKIANVLPQPIENPDFSGLVNMVVEGIEQITKEQYMDEDFVHYVYEAVIEAIYGKDFWNWRKKQRW